jgi:hypothetical protein
MLSRPDLVNGDADLVRLGRYLTATFLVEIRDREFLLRVVASGSRQGSQLRPDAEKDRAPIVRSGTTAHPTTLAISWSLRPSRSSKTPIAS